MTPATEEGRSQSLFTIVDEALRALTRDTVAI